MDEFNNFMHQISQTYKRMDFYFVFLLNIPNIEECDGYLSIILKDVICYEIILFKTVQALVKRKFKSRNRMYGMHIDIFVMHRIDYYSPKYSRRNKT